MDVNSGGAVFFCIFNESGGSSDPSSQSSKLARPETVLVLKFCANRLAAQSEVGPLYSS